MLKTVERLSSGRLRDIGPILTQSHVSMRDDFEISVPELDTAVEAALSAGALGARMTGGGFGGSAIALIGAAELDEREPRRRGRVCRPRVRGTADLVPARIVGRNYGILDLPNDPCGGARLHEVPLSVRVG